MARLRSFVSLAVGLFCLAVSAPAAEVAPFTINSARANAMGGVHAAFSDDFYALFSNPAAFASVKSETSIAALSIGLRGPVFDMIESVRSYNDTGDLDFSGLIGPNGFNAGLDISGPISFGFVGEGIGFGIFNRTYVAAHSVGLDLISESNEDLMLLGGYAFKFEPRSGHDLSVGFLGKGFIRGSVPIESSVLTVTDIGNPMQDDPFYLTAGVGMDLGTLYEYDKTYDVALVCRDLFSPAQVTAYSSTTAFINGTDASPVTNSGRIDPRWDVGFAYKPHLPILERYVSGFTVALDYHDIFGFMDLIPRNPILNVGLGAEVQVLDVLSLRAGVSDALPCAGFGLDLRFMRMDFTMRGVEYGTDPGYNPVFAMDLDLLFRY